jgi:aspartate-semialdehyde dehydrogenase
VARLARHPWFHVTAVAASDRSAGRPYGEAARGPHGEIPAGVAEAIVRACRPEELSECEIVFSALDAETAAGVEPEFAAAGFAVVSNSSAHRQAPDVPLLVPEVNASHLDLVDRQRTAAVEGYIVTNPNCSAAGLVVALAPLHRAFRIRRVVVTTLQALSGAGVEGPRALDVVDNVVPWIPGEEEKIESETRKILGVLDAGEFRPAAIEISAHCHRVATLDGHLEAVSVEFDRQVTPREAADVLAGFRGDVAELRLPSSPERLLEVRTEPDRPQPRLDRDACDPARRSACASSCYPTTSSAGRPVPRS